MIGKRGVKKLHPVFLTWVNRVSGVRSLLFWYCLVDQRD